MKVEASTIVSSSTASSVTKTVRMSEPTPDAQHELQRACALAGLSGHAGGLAEFAGIGDANIGREFPADLVAQPDAGIDVGQSGTHHAARIGLAVDIHFDLWLQDQMLRDHDVV